MPTFKGKLKEPFCLKNTPKFTYEVLYNSFVKTVIQKRFEFDAFSRQNNSFYYIFLQKEAHESQNVIYQYVFLVFINCYCFDHQILMDN